MEKKKFLSILALFALLTAGLHAQTSIILTPEIGIHSSKSTPTGDLDISEAFQGASVNYSGIFSYQGGIGVGIQFAENWGLLTGLKFNQKGGKVTVETRDPNNQFVIILDDGVQRLDVGEISETTKHNWLSIPILASGQFGGALKVGLAIGPQFNMGIGKYKTTTEFNLENTNVNDREENLDFGESTTNLLKKSHVSLLILPYVSYDLNPKSSLRFSLMFESGANMVNDNFVVATNNGTRNVNGTITNRQLGIMLSYEYRFDLNVGVKY